LCLVLFVELLSEKIINTAPSKSRGKVIRQAEHINLASCLQKKLFSLLLSGDEATSDAAQHNSFAMKAKKILKAS
jgi:hypothetical protein